MLLGLLGYFIGLWFNQITVISLVSLTILCSWTTFKRSHRLTYIIIGFFIVGAVYSSWVDQTQSWDSSWFVVTSRTEQAIIVWRFGHFYRIALPDHSLNVGDIVSISGTRERLLMNHYESRFDYGQFLYAQGVQFTIDVSSINRLWRYPFSSIKFVEEMVSSMPKISKDILGLFLWDETDVNNSLTSMGDQLGLGLYFTQSGMLLFFIEQMIHQSLQWITKKSYPLKVRIIFYSLIGLMNPFSVIIVRRFLSAIIQNFSAKSKGINWSINLIIFIIMTLFSRYIVFNWSFIAFFVIRLLGWIQRMLKPYIHPFIYPLILPLLISIFFGIVQSFSTGVFNPFSSLLMLTLLPWFSGLIVLGFFTMFFSSFLPITNIYIHGLIIWTKFLRFFNIGFQYGNHIIFWVILFMLLLSLLYALQQQLKVMTKYISFSLFFMMIFQLIPYESFYVTQLSFINVGQGDAMLLHHQHQAWLIDTGGQLHIDLAQESLIPFLRKQKIYELEGVIITHQDYDHMGALASLKENFKVKHIIHQPNAFPFFIGRIQLLNLNPIEGHPDENTNSLVLYLKIQRTFFLLMGDAGVENEEAIMKRYAPFPVNVLKVGHHGSNTSTSESFLQFTNPEVAIISAARLNRYGHPHHEVMARLHERKIQIRSTMEEGTISYKFYGSV